jgi:carbon storage regulator
MLVLSRKESERLLIGDDIVITVVRVQGDKVRIGIEAPQHIPVVRAELRPERETDPRPVEEPRG